MELFCSAIRKDSVSLLKFSFRGHILGFSYVISLICRLKYEYSCFFSHFYLFVIVVLFVFMLLMLLLAVVISLSLLFFM